MSNKLNWVILLASLILGCSAQKAPRIVEQQLHVIEITVRYDSKLNLNDVEPAIIFFEQLTGIKSESNGNYIGRLEPTQSDYNRWSDWVKTNRDKLYWDDKDQKVKFNR